MVKQMAKRKVKKDSHGLYVDYDGLRFRALPDNKAGIPYEDKAEKLTERKYYRKETAFAEGDEVNVSHPPSPSATITRKDRKYLELWYCEGHLKVYSGYKGQVHTIVPPQDATGVLKRVQTRNAENQRMLDKKEDEKEGIGWWSLKAEMFDDSELTDADVEHIAQMIKEGYKSGQLVH